MNHPFDEFSKSLGDATVPRRESLRRLGAAIAGALIAPLVISTEIVSASPDNRSTGRTRPRRLFRRPVKPPKQDACTSFCRGCSSNAKREQCLLACRTCNNDPKRLKGSCGNYVCCGSGQSYCRGVCVDVKNDPRNCGSCGRTCPAGQQCIDGKCRTPACPSGQTKCGTTCVDLLTDNNNCGACGYTCQEGATCINGVCDGGTESCGGGGVLCNGNCVFLEYDPNNCGACGNVCSSGLCTNGECDFGSPPE